jgi:hypothetical protein
MNGWRITALLPFAGIAPLGLWVLSSFIRLVPVRVRTPDRRAPGTGLVSSR